jgi:hypothetical protein
MLNELYETFLHGRGKLLDRPISHRTSTVSPGYDAELASNSSWKTRDSATTRPKHILIVLQKIKQRFTLATPLHPSGPAPDLSITP